MWCCEMESRKLTDERDNDDGTREEARRSDLLILSVGEKGR